MKNINLSKTLLLTHQHCSDGAGCATLFSTFGGKVENVKYVPAGNGVRDFVKKNYSLLTKYDHLLITDVSTDNETADTLEKDFDCLLIDHHKTALHLQNRDWCNIDCSECGTALLFDYLVLQNKDVVNHPNFHSMCRYVSLINDRDMWLNKIPESEDLYLYMDFFGSEKFVERSLLDYFRNFNSFEKEFISILKYKKQKYIENAIDRATFSEVDGVKIGYTFYSKNQSDVLNKLIIDHKCDFAISFKIENGTASIRSNDNVDCTQVAGIFGGGGHKKASGFPLDKIIEKDIIEWFESLYKIYKG